MAATSNKPSPSNRPIDSSSTAADDAPAAKTEDVAVATDPADENATAAEKQETYPTYQSVEASDVFLLAKQYLSDGKFEEGMSVIEEAIRDTQELLKRLSGNPSEDFSCHESLAPLHYLYGTTLLYSIEESDQEVTTAGSTVSAAVVSGEQGAASSSEDGPTVSANDTDNENQMATAAEIADDMEIAWENFEAARAITEEMLASNASNGLTDKLELDLAQIYLREGDLQRMNGRNENAIQDYQSCLRLRTKSKFLDTYDRKVADGHYNLALVYMNLASKDDEACSEDEQNPFAGLEARATDDEKVKEAKRMHALNKSMYHYLECSKCFCGQIASICNADPTTVTNVEAASTKGEGEAISNYKTTGEEDEEMEVPKVASFKLQTLRERVKTVVSSSSDSLSEEQKATIEDLCQLLDDIQETVDEAESATKGVQEVTNMKAEVAALAAADGEPGNDSKTGVTTTIGFGSASPSQGVAVASTAATAFNVTSTASSATSAARPMMVIKKKKRVAVQPVQQPDTKKVKPE